MASASFGDMLAHELEKGASFAPKYCLVDMLMLHERLGPVLELIFNIFMAGWKEILIGTPTSKRAVPEGIGVGRRTFSYAEGYAKNPLLTLTSKYLHSEVYPGNSPSHYSFGASASKDIFSLRMSGLIFKEAIIPMRSERHLVPWSHSCQSYMWP